MENNYFRAGPLTKVQNISERYFVQGSKDKDYGQWYLSGNKFETSNKYNPTKTNWSEDNLALVNNNNLYGYIDNNSARAFNLDGKAPSQNVYDTYVLTSKDASSGTALETADAAYISVCDKAGASLPRYDEEDMRLLDEAAGRREPEFHGPSQSTWLGIIDSQNDIHFNSEDHFYVGDSVAGGYPFLDAQTNDSLAIDSDGDGMPDIYETEKGLNPHDSSDGAFITESGYSNLELWLNGVASGTIDKARYENDIYISAQPDLPDGIEQNSALTTSRPKTAVLDNGNIFIDKDSKRYSLTGVSVR